MLCFVGVSAFCKKSHSLCEKECFYTIEIKNETENSFYSLIKKPNWMNECLVFNPKYYEILRFSSWDVLESITFSDCEINFLNGSNLKPFKSIKKLIVHHSDLTDMDLTPFSNLKFLDFSHNNLKHITEEDFNNNIQLSIIDLSHNKINVIDHDAFKGNQKVIYM